MGSRYRTLWLSDVHLGTKASRAEDLLEFLSHVEADCIYLVGDIIDLQRMKLRPSFPNSHLAVVAKLVELSRQGVEVYFIPGNHDFEFRQLVGQDLLGIPVLFEAVHQTAGGARLLIAHGDVLDGRIRKGTNLEKFGAAAYTLLMEIDVLVNRFRRMLGREYFPISAWVKSRLRGANEYIHRFEQVAAAYAAERGFDGIVCGHIHRPSVQVIDGCLYANDGDWVEHGTALGERSDGVLELLEWRSRASAVNIAAGHSPSIAA